MKIDYEKILTNGNMGLMRFFPDSVTYRRTKVPESFFIIINDKIMYLDIGSFDPIEYYSNNKLCSYIGEIKWVATNVTSINKLKEIAKNIEHYKSYIVYERGKMDTEEKKTITLTLSQIKEKLGVDELTIICE